MSKCKKWHRVGSHRAAAPKISSRKRRRPPHPLYWPIGTRTLPHETLTMGPGWLSGSILNQLLGPLMLRSPAPLMCKEKLVLVPVTVVAHYFSHYPYA